MRYTLSGLSRIGYRNENGDTMDMQKSTRVHSVSLCCCLLLLSVFTACSKKQPDPVLLNVSFRESENHQGPPFSAGFKFKWANAFPGQVGGNNTHLYTMQRTCLDGRSIAEDSEFGSAAIFLCFTIHDPPTANPASRIHTGTFPVFTQPEPSFREEPAAYALNEVSVVSLELTDHTNPGRERERKVLMLNQAAQGSIEITVSQKDRVAGKFNVNDGNLSITGAFDCPFR
jgi:hypothetical protein